MVARSRSLALRLHRALAGGLFVSVVVQVYAAGLLWYGVQQLHRSFGYAVIFAGIVAVPVSMWANGFGRRTKLHLVLAGLLVLQPVLVFVLARISPYVGALHALNAAIVLLTSVGILRTPGE